MKCRAFCFLLLTALTLSATADAQCGTRNAKAFLEVRLPGTIPVDENRQPIGRRVDSSYTLYLESAAKSVDGGLAWIGNKTYQVAAFPMEATPAMAGTEKSSGEAVQAGTALRTGWKLWRIELRPVAKKKAPAKAGAGQVVLQLVLGGKKCVQTIRTITELAVRPSV